MLGATAMSNADARRMQKIARHVDPPISSVVVVVRSNGFAVHLRVPTAVRLRRVRQHGERRFSANRMRALLPK
jgi:hypothetical protein